MKTTIRTIRGLKFKIRENSWDREVLQGVTNPKNYYIPEKNLKVVIDIGAHIGGNVILCASLGAIVYAYEPHLGNFALLIENIKLNKLENKIYPYNLGVGFPTGNRKLYLHNTNFGCFSLDKNNTTGMIDKVEIIKVISLFDIFKQHNIKQCDFLKIDCEGAEYEFILNSPLALFNKINQISMELHKGKQEKMIKFLEQFYKVNIKPALGNRKYIFCYKK